MFGRVNLLKDGAQAEGLVTAAWRGVNSHNHVAVQVRFKLPDGSTGEITDRQGLWVADVGRLHEGSVVPVRYDPAKYSRAVIDVPALKEQYAPIKAKLEAERAEREAGIDAQLEHLGDSDSSGGSPGR